MFLAVYETRRVSFDDGVVYVTRFPTNEYGVTGDNDEGIYRGFGDTPMAAIANYCEWEKEGERF